MKLKCYYRLSDQSYNKQKLTDKWFCLENFLDVFGVTSAKGVILDNCSEQTQKRLESFNLPYETTSLGNAASAMYAIKKAIEDSEDLIYFVEDDYLHDKKAKECLQEGIEHADYVTLYDHPDKYTQYYDYGEVSKVFKTKSSHWRFTQSTCMTFATTPKILKEDIEIWEKHTSGVHPHDHFAFTELKEKGRSLAVCLPGKACHTDLTFSGNIRQVIMEDWAFDLVINNLKQELYHEAGDLSILLNNRSKWDTLKMLWAVEHNLKK